MATIMRTSLLAKPRESSEDLHKKRETIHTLLVSDEVMSSCYDMELDNLNDDACDKEKEHVQNIHMVIIDH